MNKKILLIGLIIVVISMSIGYALYSTSLKVKGTGNIDSNFNIEVTGITEDKKEGKAVSITNPTYTKTSATFNTKLSREKDNIEYKVEITNKGSIDGKIENITITNPNELIKVETRGIEKGQIIKSGEAKEYIVRVYIPEGTKINEDITSKIEVNTEIIQDDNQIFNEPIDGVEANKLEIESTIEESDYTSIKCTVNAKGNGLNYSYSLDDKTYTDPTERNTYTFNNLLPNKRYTVYYKVEDKDGNYVTDSKWIETRHDNNAPECELEIKEITLDNIKIKATCADETDIVKYELSVNGGLYKDKGKDTEYNINPYSPSKLKIKATDLVGNNKEYSFTEDQLNNIYTELCEKLNNGYNVLSEKQQQVETNFLNKTYPIGSIYITTNNDNPNEIIGGAWEGYSKGKLLVGVDENDINFNNVNKTGGSKTTTLTTINLPPHTHFISEMMGTTNESGIHNHGIPALTGTAKQGTTASTGGNHTHTRGTWDITGYLNNSGGSEPKFKAPGGAFYERVKVNYYSKTIDRPLADIEGYAGQVRYDGFNFQASRNWTGATSSDGAHTHTVTTNASNTGDNGMHEHSIKTEKSISEITGSGESFTNLSKYTTVKMWKRIS